VACTWTVVGIGVLDCKRPQPWKLLAMAEAEAEDGANLDLYRKIVARAFSELASRPKEAKWRSVTSIRLEAKAIFLRRFQQLVAEAGFSFRARSTPWTLQILHKTTSLA
jgi:hypothetical protein